MRVFDLRDGNGRSVRQDDVERIIGNARSAESALVAFADTGIIGILDPVSCKTVELPKPGWLGVQAGDHVNILRDADRLVLVR